MHQLICIRFICNITPVHIDTAFNACSISTGTEYYFTGQGRISDNSLHQLLWDVIEIAKAEGKYKGRKPIAVPNFPTVYEQWKNGELTARQCMRQLNLKPNTFYRRVKEYEGTL